MEVLKNEIRRLSGSNDAAVDEILKELTPKNLKKGAFLQRAGTISQRYYFIEKGAVRLFYEKGMEEFTVWIGTPGQIFTDLESYLSGQLSRINMEALEASQVYTITKDKSDKLATQSNAYNTILRRTVEIAFVNLSKNVISFQSDQASERYERVANEKDWLSKYPLKYISSFIGITQSSLSRIRAKKD
ncbi:MAG: cyclic nucleotide-binding domain-containing protein [Cyclobacteriaceae bacterium]|nr:cyclic nucleotide-binding domain-containing protein [Cyclobacteriaceae bacterium HetDA_MAG_MS6]